MVIFHSYVSLPEGNQQDQQGFPDSQDQGPGLRHLRIAKQFV